MTIPAVSDIDFLQAMMSEHRSRGVALEYDATVEEIKDNMKSILEKVNSSGGCTRVGPPPWGWTLDD